MSLLEASIALGIVVLGFLFFIRVAWKGREGSSRIEKFFVGGRNIGVPLYKHATWGTSFAFGNGIFYFVWLGYTMGLFAIWTQVPWCLGFLGLAWILPKIIPETERYTLHGFLGSLFGDKTRRMASIASLIGFLLNLGFEISFGAIVLSALLGMQKLEVIIVLVTAIFAAAYCNIGGYNANVRTDKWQNWFGVFALIFLFFLLLILKTSDRWNFIPTEILNPSIIFKSLFDYSQTSLPFFLGIVVFSFFFQFVDMTNWQNISANSFVSQSESEQKIQIRRMRLALVKAAIWIFFFPGIFGVLLGYLLKGTEGLTQDTIMVKLILGVIPGEGVIYALVLGLLTAALIATSLSTADSWLIACSQTLSWDNIDYETLKKVNFDVTKLDESVHKRITSKARNLLFVLALIPTGVFYVLSKVWGKVFEFQFIMFSTPLSLFPILMYGLYLRYKKRAPSLALSRSAFFSVLAGLGGALFVFFYSFFKPVDTYTWTPIVTLVISAIALSIGASIVNLLTKRKGVGS